MKTLLVGVRAQDREQAAVIAGREFRIYLATSLAEGRSLLTVDDLDGIVVGVHFNDGDFFEFLNVARAIPRTAALPFIVVKAVEGRLRPDSYAAIAAACACEHVPYIDAAQMVRNDGTEEGYSRLRKRLLELLG